jgi:hypothetical protein
VSERTYLLDPLYETETLKLPPSGTDYTVMGAGAAASLTGLLATSGSITGMLASLAPGLLTAGGSLVKLGESTAVERLARRMGHKARSRALAHSDETDGPRQDTPGGGLPPHAHAAFTGFADLTFHIQGETAFPQGQGRLLAAFEWVTDGTGLKDPVRMERAHDDLAGFLEWVAATGPGACVRIAHQVSPHTGVDEGADIRAQADGDLGASYRQLLAMVERSCDTHTTVIVLSVPAQGEEIEEELAWLRTAYHQAGACGLETGPLWGKEAWGAALPEELTDGPFDVHEDHFGAAGQLHATAEVTDFRRGARAAAFWRPMVTTLPRVHRTTIIEYLPLDRRKAERRLETGEMLRTATARDEADTRREKTATRTGRRAAEIHEEDLSSGAAYVKVAARITVHAASEKQLKAARTEVEQNAVSTGAHLRWMDQEHEMGWRASLPLPGGEITC